MTNKQQGWNYALKIVMEQFQYVAWRKGRACLWKR